LIDIVEHHLRGRSSIFIVDPDDGLLAQGQDGYQLTWMDAKMGDWVCHARRGKGRGDQRALVQRALLARVLAARNGQRRSETL